jgi:hypothetical protein
MGALAQVWPQARRQSYGLAAVDSATSRLSAGLGGFYTVQDSEGLRRKATDARLVLAFPLSERLLVGASGKYLKLRQDGLGPLGTSFASGGLANESIVENFTFDAGLSIRPTNLVSIGLVGTNLTNPGDGFRPLGLSGGLGIGKREFSVEGDVAADFTTFQKTTFRYMAGAEFLAAASYPLRIGYRFDQPLKNHALSGGLGYIDQQFSVEVSVRHSVSGDRSTAVFLGLQLFLEGLGLARGAEDVDLPAAYLSASSASKQSAPCSTGAPHRSAAPRSRRPSSVRRFTTPSGSARPGSPAWTSTPRGPAAGRAWTHRSRSAASPEGASASSSASPGTRRCCPAAPRAPSTSEAAAGACSAWLVVSGRPRAVAAGPGAPAVTGSSSASKARGALHCI